MRARERWRWLGRYAGGEKELKKGRWGEVGIREKRICSLAYADDVVVLAKR